MTFIITGVEEVHHPNGPVGMKLSITMDGEECTPFTVFKGDVLVLKE
jgi:hypothetical protein